MSGLTDAEREALALVVRKNVGAYAAVEQILAARETAAVEAFRARAVEAIEATAPTWHRGMYGCPDDMFARRDLARILRHL